jgi:hypothetical protein
LLPRRDWRDRKTPGNIAAPGANIESRQAMLGEENMTSVMRPLSQSSLPGFLQDILQNLIFA